MGNCEQVETAFGPTTFSSSARSIPLIALYVTVLTGRVMPGVGTPGDG